MGGYPFFRDLVNWQILSDGVPKNELTILISQFRSDQTAKYTLEVENGLRSKGWKSVLFQRTLTAEELIESSRTRNIYEQETVANLFQRHGGDVLITGDMAAVGDVVRIRIFDKDSSEPVDVKLDFHTEWLKILTPYVESAILSSLAQAGTPRPKEYDNQFIRRILPIESKARELAGLASTEQLREKAENMYRRLSTRIAYALGDVPRLRSIRQKLENKLSSGDSFQSAQDAIVAIGDVADLLRTEALVVGDARPLDLSFIFSREIRQLLGVHDDFDYPDQDSLELYRKNTLEIESVIALACRDQQRIKELLKLYEQTAACRTDVLDASCPAWATRAIFALRYGHTAWSSDVVMLQSSAYLVDRLASMGYGGWSSHWTDPMTHANRLLRARLGIDPNAKVYFSIDVQSSIPDSVPGENACPNLIKLSVL